VFPHHVLRFNPIATGAGADRFSQGMKKSFGRPLGVAARVKKNQKVMSAFTQKNSEKVVKEAFRKASMKLPCQCKVVAG
jgi:large subunit ribosomal protein L10e